MMNNAFYFSPHCSDEDWIFFVFDVDLQTKHFKYYTFYADRIAGRANYEIDITNRTYL